MNKLGKWLFEKEPIIIIGFYGSRKSLSEKGLADMEKLTKKVRDKYD